MANPEIDEGTLYIDEWLDEEVSGQ